MKALRIACWLLCGAIAVQCRVAAVTVFVANITHDQETTAGPLLTSTGAPRPLSFGSATFTLNDAMTALTFTATIYNIDVTGTQTPDMNDNLTSAHIHAGSTAVPGSNAGVVFGFFGLPFNDTSPNDATVTPFATGVGGIFSSKWDLNEGQGAATLLTQLPFVTTGRSYINFHTAQFPGGEIRGQILPVPDTGSTALLLVIAGAALLAGWRLRLTSPRG